MRQSRHIRLTILVCAVATTLIVGAKSVTEAAGDVDPLVAEDLTYEGHVYRDGHYVLPAQQVVDLTATGGRGSIGYRIVGPPTSAGDVVGAVDVTGDAATVTIDPTAQPGPATFRYQAFDGEDRRSNVATVSFEIENRPPQTRDVRLTTTRGTPVELWPYARDAEDGGPFPWQSEGNRITYGEPANGRVEPIYADEAVPVGNKVVYLPDPGYVGPDAFDYTFSDTEGGSTSGTVTVDVTAEPPTGAAPVLYRCPVRLGANGQADHSGGYDRTASRIVSRVLGGDLLVRVEGRVRVPQQVAPGEAYSASGVGLDLTVSRSTVAMLAGDDVAGEHLELGRAGLGQTAIGGSVTARLRATEVATDRRSDVAVSGEDVEPVALSLPAPADGVTLAVRGGPTELVAPERGSVAFSLPRRFDLDASLDPGVQGVIGSVGMRCRVVGRQDLVLARTVVHTGTRTTGSAPRVRYGEPARVSVRVSDDAAGRVRVLEQGSVLGVADVRDGRATVRVAALDLAAGRHRLRLAFDGAAGFGDSRASVALRVAEPTDHGR